MRSVKLRACFAWAVLVAIGLLTSQAARAFCFAPQLRPDDEFYLSDLVIVGEVIGSKDEVDPQDHDATDTTIYRVRIERTLRGDSHQHVLVYSENTTARFPMEERHKYLLFLRKTEQGFVVDHCGNSDLLSKSTKVVSQITQSQQRKDGLIYGEVVYCEKTGPLSGLYNCGQMKVIATSDSARYESSVINDRFSFKVTPGLYQVKVSGTGEPVVTYDLPYRNPECVRVPVGGSAGVAFAPKSSVSEVMPKPFVSPCKQ